MSAYKSPGITIVNQYEPLVSPVAGGDRRLVIVGEQVVSNLNLFPTQVIEARREATGPDELTLLRGEIILGSITDATRVLRVWQGGTVYTAATAATNIATATATGATDSVVFSTLTDPASAYDVFAVYQKTATAFNTYVEAAEDGYTATLTAGAGGLEVDLTWDPEVEPALGTTYTIVVGDATVDYHVAVDNVTETEKIYLYMYWNTASTTVAAVGSAYLTEVYKEFPGERALYTSFDEVVKTCGPLVDPTNPDFTDVTAVNTLVLAAYLAFREGAPAVMLVPYLTGTLALTTALQYLATDDSVNIITVLDASAPTTGGVTPTDLVIAHVKDASSEASQKFRIAVINPDVGAFNDAYNTTDDDAYNQMVEVCDSIRVVLVGPSEFNFNVPLPVTGEFKEVRADGIYGAIIYGAMMARPEYDIATAMLRKESRTITKIRATQQWDDIKLDMIAALGVTLFAKINGVYKVRDDITTNQDGLLLKNEPSITMVADSIARTAIDVLDAGVIGGKLKLPTTLETVKSILISMLSRKADNELIQTFGDPDVQIDATDPRKIVVIVPIVPMFKTREIKITFSYTSSL